MADLSPKIAEAKAYIKWVKKTKWPKDKKAKEINFFLRVIEIWEGLDNSKP